MFRDFEVKISFQNINQSFLEDFKHNKVFKWQILITPMKKVSIKISNKATYSILAIVLIVLAGAVVFAYGTGDPYKFGHSAGELTGVCKYDGVDQKWIFCPTFQDNLNLYINEQQKLCWPTTVINGCQISIPNCNVVDSIQFEDMGICDPSASTIHQNRFCNQQCTNMVACDGDSTPYECGLENYNPTKRYFSSGVKESCGSNVNFIYCTCSVSGQGYYNENPIATGESCVSGIAK